MLRLSARVARSGDRCLHRNQGDAVHLPTWSRPAFARRRSVRWCACALALSVLAAACGGSHGSGGEGTTATTAAGGTSTTAPSGATFGTLKSPCGAGDAKGATATGVTDTSITIGYGDDAGYSAAPGLDKEMGDAVKAMIGWCNQQGGINGRKVVGNYYDAKVLNVTQIMTQACSQVFMLVGQGWVLDSGQEQTRIGCKLSTIAGYSVS